MIGGTNLARKWSNYGGIFDVETHRKKAQELDSKATEEGFWDNQEAAQKVLKAASAHRKTAESFDETLMEVEEFEVYMELLQESPDDDEEAEDVLQSLTTKVEGLELQRMLSGRDDSRDCILTINAGAGGTESQDWAQMLMRMYLRYLERRSFDFQVLEIMPGEEAGVKSVSIEVSGDHPFGYLRAEVGVHRLVRISPFDSNARRHTSFASVFVYPKVDDDVEIDINPVDLRIDTYRASGAGGQHVNKTDSAVRITHLPTNIVVTCQAERSQHRNREKAMAYLRARLYQRHLDEEAKKREKLEEGKGEIGWGNQIRSYVFHPYRMVKDLRTGVETGNVDNVMDGDIHEFIAQFLLGKRRSKHSGSSE